MVLKILEFKSVQINVFSFSIRRFNSLGASVYIRRIYLHCIGDYRSRTSTGDKTKVLFEPCTLTSLTD